MARDRRRVCNGEIISQERSELNSELAIKWSDELGNYSAIASRAFCRYSADIPRVVHAVFEVREHRFDPRSPPCCMPVVLRTFDRVERRLGTTRRPLVSASFVNIYDITYI